jgi:hypothetical protein
MSETLNSIKGYLRITWNDDDGAVSDLIARGKAKINELTGADQDFDTEGLARSLLYDYCRYAYNNASEYWEENFQREILRLQLIEGVKEAGDETES